MSLEEVKLPIEVTQFRKTNALWNELMLNDPWSVGYVTTLIENQPFENSQDWFNYYYQSGELRNKQVSKLNDRQIAYINDNTVILRHYKQIQKFDWSVKNLNFNYGRTLQQLNEKAAYLHEKCEERDYGLTLKECQVCVIHRVLGETWNGIVVRERNTIEKLQQLFPGIVFRKTEGSFDHKYAVDYELYFNNKRIVGIQIKPKSYTFNTPYIKKARQTNLRKNNNYKSAFGVPVYDVISDSRGNVLNQEVLRNIRGLMR